MSDTIKLAENKFKLVPEGEDVNLTITKVAAKPKADPKVIEVEYTHESGAKILNKYNIAVNGGLVAFSILARCVLGSTIEDFSISNDLPKLKGVTIDCEVKHEEYNGKMYANVKKTKHMVEPEDNLDGVEPVDGEDEDDL